MKDLDDNFLRCLAIKLQSYQFAPDDTIVHAGQLAKEMYFIRRGLCEVVDASGEVCLWEIGPGQCFGEMAMLFGQYQAVNIVAKTYVEVRGSLFS